MKKTLLCWAIGGLLVATGAQAQSTAAPRMPIDEATNLITYSDVVEEPGMNKDTIYNRVVRWFKSYYKNPLEAMKKQDPEGRVVEGGYRFTIQRPEPGAKKQPAPMVDAGLVNYKIKVMCKDGKFKYEITNISWKQTSYYPIERWMDDKASNYDPNYALYLQQTDAFMKELIKNLERFVETDPVKKKDDW